MERLTTDKKATEMGVYELAHNCCYIKDGLSRYRDFEIDMDARDFARNLMTTLANEDMSLDDELFDEEIMENLTYDQFSDVKGLIALFYRNLWAMSDLREHLKSYEDAEENGMLIHLPCRVGDTVYFHWRCSDETTIVCPATVKEICIGTYMLRKTTKYKIEPKGSCGMIKLFYASDCDNTIFSTREAAEQALAKMEWV